VRLSVTLCENSPDSRLVIPKTRLLAAAALTLLVLWPVALAAALATPTARTDQADPISDRAATLNGWVGVPPRPNGNANGQDQTTDYRFEYNASSAPSYSESTPDATRDSGEGPATAAIAGLQPGTTYHFRVRAQNADGVVKYGDDRSFRTTGSAPTSTGTTGTTGTPSTGPGSTADSTSPGSGAALSAAAGRPALGTSVVIAPLQGTIKIKVPGAADYTTLAAGDSVPVGTVIDARHGTIRLTSAVRGGTTQSGEFRGALFAVRQARTGGGMTDLVLRGEDFAHCPRTPMRVGVRAAATASSRPPMRRLWSRDKGGRFRTHGRNSVAAVRGTAWVTTDTCAGTRTTVSEGAVAVRDTRRGKTVLVRAGHSYLARSAR
jgi:hypothetical protein